MGNIKVAFIDIYIYILCLSANKLLEMADTLQLCIHYVYPGTGISQRLIISGQLLFDGPEL